ncbi:MAG: hypothetical protein OXU23_04925 [Candidatus Poribacteria bacterium]|nr:hypothetical protein [Candidatus Poribacteria bacterium]
MLKSFFFSKPFVIGIAILLFVSTLCFLYYQSVITSIEKEQARDDKMIKSLTEEVKDSDTHEINNGDIDLNGDSDIVTPENPVKTNEALGVDHDDSDVKPSVKENNLTMPEMAEKEIRMSPFGFGAYPEIPQPYRDLGGVQDIWGHFEELAKTDPDQARIQELGERVLVKLWNEGLQPEGANYSEGKFFPQYPNTVYVQWDTITLEDGSIEEIPSRVVGDPAFSQFDLQFYESNGQDVPAGFNLLDYDKDGIDPYQFLNLK